MSELNLLKMQSDDLTLRFFSDLVHFQQEKVKKHENKLGELLVSLRYDKEKSSLHVHVIQGKNLPVMDRVGEDNM